MWVGFLSSSFPKKGAKGFQIQHQNEVADSPLSPASTEYSTINQAPWKALDLSTLDTYVVQTPDQVTKSGMSTS